MQNINIIQRLIMHTIHIDNAELESFINSQYGKDDQSLMADFITFVKTELIINDLKNGFDEVELYKHNKTSLSDARDFLTELKK
jgi:ABC-type sulfate transport system substrate-binding protein